MSTFTPSAAFSLANRIVAPLIKWGLPMGPKRAPMALLTVPGRKTGVLRTSPVALAEHDDQWLLVSVYGVSDWSRNLEAAGRGEIIRRGRRSRVKARRLGPEEGGPILRSAMLEAPAVIRHMTGAYFSAGRESPLHDWEEETLAHPTFLLTETT